MMAMTKFIEGGLMGGLKAASYAVGIVFFLVDVSGGDKEVKGCFEGFLWIVKEGMPSVPSSGTKGTRRIHQSCKGATKIRIDGVSFSASVHVVLIGMIEGFVASDFGAEPIHSFEVGFDIGFPFPRHPGGTTLLETCRSLYRKGCGAVCGRWI